MLRAAVIKHYFFKLLARFQIFSIKGQKVVFQGLFGIGFDFVDIARERKIYIAARHADGDTVYAVWSPTNDGTTVDVSISIDADEASLVELTDSYTASVSAATLTDGAVTVTASETPVFIVVD